MNVTMIYFSLSGNTSKVAETMADAFRESGHVVRIVSLKKATTTDATDSELLGIGTSCLCSQAPTPIKSFLSSLSPLDKKRAFVFATSGAAPGRVLYDLSQLLRSKGADLVGGFLTRGTIHHPAPCLFGRMPNRPNTEDLARARRFAVAVAKHVSTGRLGLVAENRLDTLKLKGGFYDVVGLISTDSMLRLSMPKPRLDPTRCDQCKWCVNECPMHNITLQPYPELGKKCIRCYRCLSGCPQKAFKVSWILGNLAILSFYNTAFERWFGDLEPGETIY